jgi:phosphoribosyl 1,2-cyclic phosphodiesterase
MRWNLIDEETGETLVRGTDEPGNQTGDAMLLGLPNQVGTTVQQLASFNGKRVKMVWDRNRRRNTSAVFLYKHSDGSTKTILIDAGKTTYTAALDWFVKYRLRRIDALILTHGHADAVFGMDDLRQWTIGAKIQKSVDIYLNDETLGVVSGAYPYMVDKTRATGGGDVPSLRFHVIGTEPFTLFEELVVTPLPVEHGQFTHGEPYYAFGYRMEDVAYISDASLIPNTTMDRLKGVKVFALDALRDTSHPSHFSTVEAMEVFKQVRARYGIMTGFCHYRLHDDINSDLMECEEELRECGVEKCEAAWDGMVVDLEPWLGN